MSDYVPTPPFTWSLLAPKYWLSWLWMGILYFISWLPYSVQIIMGKAIGRLFYRLNPRRTKIARRNIQLCFPEWDNAEVERITKLNMEKMGTALLETGMAWFWPQWRINRHLAPIEGIEHIDHAIAEGRKVYILMFHFLPMEMANRAFGRHYKPVSLYRPHDNNVIDFVMYRGRVRSQKYLVSKKNLRGFMRAAKKESICVFLPDQDYSWRNSQFVPFCAVEQAATTLSTLAFIRDKTTKVVTCYAYYDDRIKKYRTVIRDGLDSIPSGDNYADLEQINQQIESALRAQPEYYLWAHRRFKTRPEGSPSLYDNLT